MAPGLGLGKSTSKRVQTTLSGTGSGLQPGTSTPDVNYKNLLAADAQAADREERRGMGELRYASKYTIGATRQELQELSSVLGRKETALPIQTDEALHTEVEGAEQEKMTFESLYEGFKENLLTGVESLSSDKELHNIANKMSNLNKGMRQESAQLKERIGRQRMFLKGLETSIVDKQERAEHFRMLEETAVSNLQAAIEAKTKPAAELDAERLTLEREVADADARLKLAVDATQKARRELETVEAKRSAAQAETERLDALRRSAQAEHGKLTVTMAGMQAVQHNSNQIGSVVAASDTSAGQVAGLEAKVRELEGQLREAKVLVGQIPGLKHDLKRSEEARVRIQADLDSERLLRKSKEDLLPL